MKRHVYECVNWTRREHLVAVSELDEAAFAERLRAAPPEEAAAWERSDKVVVECVAKDMPEGDARVFVENYVSTLDIPGWTVRAVRGPSL